MAGNLNADNSGNILCEFDYNNIIVVDPNRTIDALGNIQERIVDHENLVMYANLEAEVLPRTKLAVGGVPGDRVRTISVAKMNFLKPTKNSYLSTGYYDEITGENTTKFRGENQMMQKAQVPANGDKPYVIDAPFDLNNVLDNGLLGITQINIQTNSSFVPSVKIELEDVQGRALFQLGNNSPYAAFFNLPYPPFYLTLKGFYGQAIRYQLNLERFNARFNSFSGNYQVSLEFRGYKFNVLNEIAMGHLLALPHMYSQTFDVASSPVDGQTNSKTAESQSKTQNVSTANSSISQNNVVSQITAERGYQKIIEVYSEYKAKGLIPYDFPELTILQLMNKLENFEKNIQNSFTKAEVEPLTNIRNYKTLLRQYFDAVRGSGSWFSIYLNPKPLIKKDGQKIYTFKKLDLSDKDEAVSKLKSYVDNFNNSLSRNPTLGNKGTDKIENPITFKNLIADNDSFEQIDWEQTAKNQLGVPTVTEILKQNVQKDYSDLLIPVLKKDAKGNYVNEKPYFFVFEGEGRFDKQIASLESQANKKLSFYETDISTKLLKKIESKATGIGFKPSVRNISAVIMASAEAFLRMMDDVHTNAWSVKYDPVRKLAILDNNSSAPNPETRDHVVSDPAILMNNSPNDTLENAQIPVYPWPQFFQESPEDAKGRFQLKYIGDPSVVDITKGYLYDKWPEVEFVEEYMKGITKKFDAPQAPEPLANERETNIITINAIEFPSSGIAYANKEEVKFFYEIWERQFLTSHYSGYNRANSNQSQDLIKLNDETEINNIYESVNVSSPYLSLKLKNYTIDANNYDSFLQGISNNGTGRAYQDFIRDFFVTPYIRTLTEIPNSILDLSEIGKIPQSNAKSEALTNLIKLPINEKLIVDTVPFSDQNWVVSNMSDGVKATNSEVYNTNKTYKIFGIRKVIANFSDLLDYSTNRPVTNFSYLNYSDPSLLVNESQNNQVGLNAFYTTRVPKDFSNTEGYVYGNTPSSNLPYQTTTSLLNTPYFINAIQNGVYNSRKSTPYPYVQAAYFFINSLPLASLREKYKTYTSPDTKDLDYIASLFNKFGAVHKLPYAWIIKLGSVWHRYKKYKETGVDILSGAWKNFDYLTNYSPVLSSTTQAYSFKYTSIESGQEQTKDVNIVLQEESQTDIKIATGFYPKVISDFCFFFNSFDMFVKYDNTEIQKWVDLGMKVYSFPKSFIDANQNGKNVRLSTYSIILPNYSDTPVTNNCTTAKSVSQSFIMPSFGSQVNQTKYECIPNLTTNNSTSINLTNNDSMYNGSVRTIWSAPNYGYFDNDQLVMPKPDSYLNKIDPNTDVQSPFKLLTDDTYSKIEEIFSVFEKKDLDNFEIEFLNFCKPITEADTAQQDAQYNTSTVNMVANFRNFQSLFKSMMTINGITPTQTDTDYFNSVITTQFQNVKSLLQSFLQYDVLFRCGNPTKYRRRIFDSYLSYGTTAKVVDPIKFNPYVAGSLPTRGGTITLSQSKLKNPTAWVSLETEVGFSTIPNVEYSSFGSYITDFFVDNNIEFSNRNVVLLAPLIKMYGSSKLLQPSLNAAQFKNQLTLYLQGETELQNYFINQVMAGVRAKLPDQQQLPEKVITSAISGEQSKIENYEVFKALNDKWIAGADYTNQTLFEDILFLDRASRNIGEKILIDIFDLKSMFGKESLNQAMSVFTFLSGILIKNNFTVMNLPAYVNFYNIENIDGTSSPKPEGSLEFANSMWGTFLDVDYRKSAPKMVCFYVGKPSQYLDLPKGNFRFRDDAFELRRASENPLIENQQGKKDWAVSNKCVGFSVDLGIRNQNVFYSFSVSQEGGVATSESINTQINMVDQATGRNTATQNVGLYNLYKNRSYKASVTCLGNALLQPTMYFNLRHVPMFNGPYMILDVQHAIQPGNFQTTFTGVRQGAFDLPAIDSYLQSINQNLLTRLEELLQIKKDSPIVPASTDQQKSNEVVQKADNTADTSNSCVSNVDVGLYKDYLNNPAKLTSVNAKEFADVLNAVYPATDDNTQALKVAIYVISYVLSFQQNSNTKGAGEFKGWSNNFGNISLYLNWNPSPEKYFTKSYSCVNVKGSSPNGKSQPLVAFESLKKYVEFMGARIQPNVGRILQQGILKYYVCNWPKNNGVSETYFQNNVNQYSELQKTIYNGISSAQSVNLLPKDSADNFKKTMEEVLKQLKTIIDATKAGQTPPPNTTTTTPPNSTTPTECLPKATSFSPVLGTTGTIVTIKGENLDKITNVSVIQTTVDPKNITHLSPNMISIVIPKIGNGDLKKDGYIVLSTDNSTIISFKNKFTYDPSLTAASTSSPGALNGTANGVAVPQPAAQTNPQSTGPNPLVISQKTKNPNGGDEILVVKVNTDPTLGTWKIDTQPEYNCTVAYVEVGPNNKITENVVHKSNNISLPGFVSQDQQTFSITRQQFINSEFKSDIKNSEGKEVRIKTTIELYARPTDKQKYPNDVIQNYNFEIVVPRQQVIQNAPGKLSLVSDTNNLDLPNFSGPSYYNIKKPKGGYYTFQFTCTNLLTQGKLYVNKLFLTSPVNFTVRSGADTKYTNVVEISDLGTFEMSVEYTSSDYTTLDVNGKQVPIDARAYSIGFLLS